MTLETPLGAVETRQCRSDAIEIEADAFSHGNGGKRVLQVVSARHCEFEPTERFDSVRARRWTRQRPPNAPSSTSVART